MLRRHTRLSLPHTLHFITTVTQARGPWFIEPVVCRDLLAKLEQTRVELGLMCIAYVLMPDHLHALLLQDPRFDETGTGHVSATRDLAEGGKMHAAGDKYALPIGEFMRRFKRRTSTHLRIPDYPEDVTLWHRRYDDVPVGSANAFRTRINYIHNNPVKKSLAETPEAYPWSSARTYVTHEQGIVRVEFDLVGPYTA